MVTLTDIAIGCSLRLESVGKRRRGWEGAKGSESVPGKGTCRLAGVARKNAGRSPGSRRRRFAILPAVMTHADDCQPRVQLNSRS
jgi:hypothetical protein